MESLTSRRREAQKQAAVAAAATIATSSHSKRPAHPPPRPSLRFPPPPAYPPVEDKYDLDEEDDRIQIYPHYYTQQHGSRGSFGRQHHQQAVHWRRDNIAATMERFEPSDYSYAYYEPGPATRHSLSSGGSGSSSSQTTRCHVHSNSITNPRPSTSSAREPIMLRSRHDYITRYGTQENIYEEISAGLQRSAISLGQSVVEEELRRVQHRHRRVLGELNLSVEAMLMPPADSPDEDQTTGLEPELPVGPTDELLSPAPADPDSGFSGSSSGASYVGSLRYRTHKSEPPMHHLHQQLAPQDLPGHGGTTTALNNTAPTTTSTSMKGFWKKGWRKFSSSSGNVNKSASAAAANNNSGSRRPVVYVISTSIDEPRPHPGAWEDPLTTLSASVRASTGRRRKGAAGGGGRIHVSEDSWGSNSDHELSTDDESDRSATSTASRSQLRSTLNKARTLWRSSGGSSGSSSMNGSMNSSGIASAQPGADPAHPGDGSPGGRLSRWFSMRRGSSHQYDIGGSVAASNNAQLSAAALAAAAAAAAATNNNHSTVDGSSKMPQLAEMDEDPNTTITNSTPRGKGSFHGRTSLSSSSGSNSINHTSRASSLPANNDTSTTATVQQQFPLRKAAPPTLPPPPPGLSELQRKRRLIVQSIVHSENSYVATLQRLVNDYKKPLEESNPAILNSAKISTLFLCLPEILQCHSMFRHALAERVRAWDRDERLGDVFFSTFSKSQVLEIYSGFINNFSVAMELAKMESKRKSALADFFKVKQMTAHDRLSFFGLMVKPVQRFPQFIMFLQDLLKDTPQGHHDRMNLQLALTQLESLAEMLNERKREAEQSQAFRETLARIGGALNVRSLSDAANRYLIREDDVTQLEYNQNGMITKSKPRRLLLLNDRVVCVSVTPRHTSDFGAAEKLTFKWMHPAADVEIQDSGASPTLSRILTAGLNRGGSLKSSSNAENGGGADSLCGEMNALMHDYEAISRIAAIVNTLKGNYPDLQPDTAKRILQTIQSSIQRKDEEMAWLDSCCLQLIARAPRGGKEETYTFQTAGPSVRRDWLTELRLAQLALDSNNSPAWLTSDSSPARRPATRLPLFVKAHCVYRSQHKAEVRCGCYYNAPANAGRTRSRGAVSGYVWLCTSDGASSHLSVLSVSQRGNGGGNNSTGASNTGTLRDCASHHLVETRVTALEHARGPPDAVWLGTDARRIMLYAANDPDKAEPVCQTSVQAPITQLKYHCDAVFVALADGNLLIYRRSGHDRTWWPLRDPQVVNLGTEMVTSLLPTTDSGLFASCGKKVSLLNAHSGEVMRGFSVTRQDCGGNVSHLALSGIGLWVALRDSSLLCLYHSETFRHLQDIDVAPDAARVDANVANREVSYNNAQVTITALMACKGLLWVGTSTGACLTVPLPRLEGVPIIGRFDVSYHAHSGPVSFLLPLYSSKSYNDLGTLRRKEIDINDENTNNITSQRTEIKNNSDSTTIASSKLRQQLANSPVVLRRRRSKDGGGDVTSRGSKTLPRSLGSFSAASTTSSQGSGDTCDVYGLYGELMYIKDYEDTATSFESPLRRSDPELAAIPGKVSTLDRRLRWKCGRPRSLDLSNWSPDDSRCSSGLCTTSSGSEESVAASRRGVSRNNSAASERLTPDITSGSTMATLPANNQATVTTSTSNNTAAAKNSKKRGGIVNSQDSKRTIITLCGGRGYLNWKPQGYTAHDKQKQSGVHTGKLTPNMNDAHIIMWEKKL